MGPTPTIDVGVASRPMPGERALGDHHVVAPFAGGMLLAVIDGLGHGEDASAASSLAARELARDPTDSVIGLVKACHRTLTGSRGVAMSVASIDMRRGVLTWIGVGNVEGVVIQRESDGRPVKSHLVTRSGVVGARLPMLRAEVLDVSPGDMLVFATDGIDLAFADDLEREPGAAQPLADALCAQFARPNDDALVLVARAGNGG